MIIIKKREFKLFFLIAVLISPFSKVYSSIDCDPSANNIKVYIGDYEVAQYWDLAKARSQIWQGKTLQYLSVQVGGFRS